MISPADVFGGEEETNHGPPRSVFSGAGFRGLSREREARRPRVQAQLAAMTQARRACGQGAGGGRGPTTGAAEGLAAVARPRSCVDAARFSKNFSSTRSSVGPSYTREKKRTRSQLGFISADFSKELSVQVVWRPQREPSPLGRMKPSVTCGPRDLLRHNIDGPHHVFAATRSARRCFSAIRRRRRKGVAVSDAGEAAL